MSGHRLAVPFVCAVLLPIAPIAPIASVAAQGTFSGSVTYQVDPASTGMRGGPSAMTFTVSGTHRRIDITMAPPDANGQAGGMGGMAALMGRSISTITDESSDSMKTLFNDKKMYITMPAPGRSQLPPEAQAKIAEAGKGAAGSFIKTGKTETIAGVPCDDYLYTPGDSTQKKTEICNASGMGFLWASQSQIARGMQQMGGGLSAQYAAVMQEFKNGFFPLKVVVITGGQEHMQMVATKIDRTKPPASMFEVPSDFTSLQMGGLGAPGMGTPRGP